MINLYTAPAFFICKEKLLETIKSVDTKNLEKTHIILVPDQYSLTLEKQVLNVLQDNGALNIEVLTFSRLILKLKDIDTKKYIQLSDAVMIMRKLCIKHSSEFLTFAKSANLNTFAENILMLINQFKSSGITANFLKENLNKLNTSFSKKLYDIAFLYEKYTEFLGNEYFDSSDILGELPQIIKNSPLISKCDFYIIGYDSLTKLAENAIEAVAKYANNINLFAIKTARFDLQKINLVYEKFLKFCDKETVLQNKDSKTAEVIKENLFSKNIYKTAENCNIDLYECTAKFSEAKACAADINFEVLKNNLRYKDIGVVFTDENMGRVLSSVFLEYGIPSYIENKKTLNLHPFSKLVLDIINVLRLNFDRESFLEIVKNPFIKTQLFQKDAFENYILKYAIDRQKLLEPLDDFTNGSDNFITAENVRLSVLKIINLMKLKKSDTGFNYCQNIRNFISAFNAQKALDDFNNNLNSKNYLEYLGYSEQVLSNIEEILAGAEYIFKDTVFKLDEFYKILYAGFSAKELSLIPKVTDCVTCGDYKSVVFSDYKKLYVLGCEKNAYPKITENIGIIKDEDIDLLKDAGLDLEPKTEDINEREKYFIYSMLLNFKKLFMSYSGDPAECFCDISLSFTKDGKSLNAQNFEQDNIKELYTKNRAVKNARIKILRIKNKEYDDGTAYAVLNAVKDKYKIELDDLYSDSSGKTSLKEKIGNVFFTSGSASVTAVETYFSCPYKHFLKYGICAKERDIAQFKPVDVGRFLHLAAENFVKRNNFNEDIKNVSEQLFNEIIENDEYKKYLNDPFSKDVLFKLKDELKRLLEAICAQFKNSDFKPLYTEFKFGKNDFPIELFNGDKKITLKGVIDRIDLLEISEGKFIRIIDYKSGKSQYSEQELYYGKKIQLFIYLYALIKDKIYRPAGAYYFPVHNKFTKADMSDSVYCMAGPTLNNYEVLFASDFNLEKEGNGKIINVKIKDGKITKYSKVLSEEDFIVLCDYAKLLCDNFVKEVNGGNIEILPLESVCSYCEYISVCKNYGYKNQRKLKAVNLENIREAVLCRKI